ncbi:hypothetical protein JMJ77_0006109 [Colletotrichum scovillei]|uniref:Uncharacterized protein n=1 Tax=Colletotrichum scovillei TaxID=1209932 RepID=A0A9P7RK55_9PEZI|nr:hypothetical protein JMJ77_0006109 [Colletotrichum scovillei]KAG7077340.1 hypothetical protein JMJ76_0014588 [Colletotrichum scovillei]KAG7084572.1 hypothetical protein JMJ78_0010006 [Colletotrichum scovillei]
MDSFQTDSKRKDNTQQIFTGLSNRIRAHSLSNTRLLAYLCFRNRRKLTTNSLKAAEAWQKIVTSLGY